MQVAGFAGHPNVVVECGHRPDAHRTTCRQVDDIDLALWAPALIELARKFLRRRSRAARHRRPRDQQRRWIEACTPGRFRAEEELQSSAGQTILDHVTKTGPDAPGHIGRSATTGELSVDISLQLAPPAILREVDMEPVSGNKNAVVRRRRFGGYGHRHAAALEMMRTVPPTWNMRTLLTNSPDLRDVECSIANVETSDAAGCRATIGTETPSVLGFIRASPRVHRHRQTGGRSLQPQRTWTRRHPSPPGSECSSPAPTGYRYSREPEPE